ncbi:hypothetical protein FACS189499_02380 [Clostridia bacterium]|nr:hypothetical protein FACS189499_02380 [Clostridia bacterium]
MNEHTAKKSILVVDDMQAQLTWITEILGDDFNVQTAKSGAETLEILRGLRDDSTPDLLLIDIEMPEMDGFELAAEIRLKPHLENVPIAFFTANAGSGYAKEGLALGITDYIVKPITAAELKERVQIIIDEPIVIRKEFQNLV